MYTCANFLNSLLLHLYEITVCGIGGGNTMRKKSFIFISFVFWDFILVSVPSVKAIEFHSSGIFSPTKQSVACPLNPSFT